MRAVVMIPGVVGEGGRRSTKRTAVHPVVLPPDLGMLLDTNAPTHELAHVRSVASWFAIRERVTPVFVAGHSRGLYPALVVAGCVSAREALNIERRAWKLIRSAGESAPSGLLAVMGGNPEHLESIWRHAAGVEPAIINAPTQIVLGGNPTVLQNLAPRLERAGALQATILRVPGAVHTSRMVEAGARLREWLAPRPLAAPRVPLLDMTPSGGVVTDPAGVRDLLARQLSEPCAWGDRLRALPRSRFDAYLDLGPGDTLARILRWVDRDARVLRAADVLAR